MHVNHFVLHITKGMCVFISLNIHYSCQLLHIECGHHSTCCHGTKYTTVHYLQQFMHEHIIPHISFEFLYSHPTSITPTCAHGYMYTCVRSHIHACTCEKMYKVFQPKKHGQYVFACLQSVFELQQPKAHYSIRKIVKLMYKTF